ncbi:MAG: AsmA family protein [Woeseiaceae bacterium]
MRYLRIGMYALLGLIAIIVVALVIVLTIDLGRFKPQVENLVSELTGREFAIRGALKPSIGWQVHVLAEDIELAATDWSEYKDLVSARRLEIKVDTWSLISGPIEIESVSVDGLRLHLEKNQDGINNWTFQVEAEGAEEATEQGERPTLPVVIDRADITDLRLTFDSPNRPRPLDFVVNELTERILESDDIKIALDGALNETSVTLEGTIGSATNLVGYREIAFDLAASLGEIEIDGQGKVDDLLAPSRPELRLTIDGPGAEYMMQVLRLDPVTSGPMSLNASLEPDGEQMLLNVESVFGEFDFVADGRFVNLQEINDIDLAIKADGPDIGNIIRLAGGEYTEVDPFDLQANIRRAGPQVQIDGVFLRFGESNFHISGRFSNFPDVKGADVRLDISGTDFGRFNRLFGFPGNLDGPFSMIASLSPMENGRAAIEVESRAQDIQIRAHADVAGSPPFTGSSMNVSVSGSDLSVIGKAIGFENAQNEKFEFTGTVVRAETGVILNDFVAIVGDDRLALDGPVGDEPLKNGTDLKFDYSGTDIKHPLHTFDVKADRLPVGPFSAVGRLRSENENLVLENVRASIGAQQEYKLNADGVITNLQDFYGSRLQVGLSGNSLAALGDLAGLPDIPDVDYDISATIERRPGSLRISSGVAHIGSTSAKIDGSIGDDSLQKDTDLRFHFSAPDLVYSLGKFGIEIDRLPASELELRGQLRNQSGLLTLRDLNVSYAGLTADVSGNLGELPTMDGTNLDVLISGDDFSQLLESEATVAELAKSYRVATNVRISSGQVELNELKASLGNVSLGGRIALGIDPVLGKGRFELVSDSPDLFQLFPKLTEVSVPTVAPMRFSGAGNWQDNYWQFDDVTLFLGNGSLKMDGGIDGLPGFDRTDLKFDWHISSLNNLSVVAGREMPDHSATLRFRLSGTRTEMMMEDFVGRIGDSDITSNFSMRGGEIPKVQISFNSDRLNLAPYLPPLIEDEPEKPPPADGRLIPDRALPLDLLRKFDADVYVNIGELIGRVLVARDFHIDGSVESGALRVRRISLTGQRGGTLAAEVSLVPDESSVANLAVNVQGSDLILGLQAGDGVDIEQLPLYELNAELAGRGNSLREVAASLNGFVRMVGAEGRIASSTFDLFTGDVMLEIISKMNPFVKSDPFTNIECSAFLAHVSDGKVVGTPVLVQKTDKLQVLANADIDLHNERIKVDFHSIPQRGLGISFSTLITPYVQLTGTMARPKLSLDAGGTIIEGGAAVATVGLSILAKSFKDRFFSSKDPCGDAVMRHDEVVAKKASAAQN